MKDTLKDTLMKDTPGKTLQERHLCEISFVRLLLDLLANVLRHSQRWHYCIDDCHLLSLEMCFPLSILRWTRRHLPYMDKSISSSAVVNSFTELIVQITEQWNETQGCFVLLGFFGIVELFSFHNIPGIGSLASLPQLLEVWCQDLKIEGNGSTKLN